jgi:hypothetical protein
MKTEKTKIEFDWNGKHIVLEYTADSLRKMEKRGFDVSEADKRLLSLGEDLFCGAFIENHDDIKEKERRELYKEISASDEDGNEIDAALAEMFSEAIEEIQSHRGNVKWRMTR